MTCAAEIVSCSLAQTELERRVGCRVERERHTKPVLVGNGLTCDLNAAIGLYRVMKCVRPNANGPVAHGMKTDRID